jgi:hypothetical protein
MENINFKYLLIIFIIFSCEFKERNIPTNQQIIDSSNNSKLIKKNTLKLDQKDSLLSKNLKQIYLTKKIKNQVNIEINYPIINGLTNSIIEDKINNRIKGIMLGEDFAGTPEDKFNGLSNDQVSEYYGFSRVRFLDSNLYSLNINRALIYFKRNIEDSSIQRINADEVFLINYDLQTGKEIDLTNIINDTIRFKSYLIKYGKKDVTFPDEFVEIATSLNLSEVEYVVNPEEIDFYIRYQSAQRGYNIGFRYSDIKNFINDEYLTKLKLK